MRQKARQVFGGMVACLAWSETAAWQKAVAEADAVLHLAGTPVADGRWTPEIKRSIRDSRVETTRAIANVGPRVLVSASAVGYYGGAGDTVLTEDSPHGDDFLADVCVRWEDEARQAEAKGSRVVMPRIGIVLGPEGGPLQAMLNPPMAPSLAVENRGGRADWQWQTMGSLGAFDRYCTAFSFGPRQPRRQPAFTTAWPRTPYPIRQ